MQDRMHFVLDPRPMPDDLIASRGQPALPLGFRVRSPDFQQVSCCKQTRQRASMDLIASPVHVRSPSPARDYRSQPSLRRAREPGRPPCNCRSPRSPPRRSPFQGRPSHVDPAEAPQPAVLPYYHLAEGPVDVDANHPSHLAPPFRSHRGGGRHDTYGFALAAQPGKSQRRPATS